MSQDSFQGQDPSNQPVPPYGVPPAPGQQPPYSQPQPGQQGSYYQQPYPPQGAPTPQPPYGQAPYAAPQQAAKQLNVSPGYLTAGIAAVVGFIAFFLPYYTISYSYGGILGVGSVNTSISLSGSQGGGAFVLDLLISLAAMLVVATILFGKSLLGSSTAQGVNSLINSLTTKARTWDIVLLAVGGAGALLHLLFMLTSGQGGYNLAGTGVSVSWGIGAFLYLAAMIGIAVGGFLEMRKH